MGIGIADNDATTSIETAGSLPQITTKNVVASAAGIYDDHAYPLEIRNELQEEE